MLRQLIKLPLSLATAEPSGLRTIVRQASILLLLTTVARLLTAGAALVLAYYFGTSATMDRYTAFSLVTTALPSLFAAALPVLVARHVAQQLDRNTAVAQCRRWGRQFAGYAVGAYLLAVVPLAWGLSPVKTLAAIQPLVVLLLLGLPCLATASLVAVEQTLLQTKGQLYVASACQSVSSVVALAAASASGLWGGLELCAAGVALGGVVEYFVLRRQGEAVYAPAASIPAIPVPLKTVLALASSGGAALIGGLMDQAYLANMGPSTQATWGLASRIPSFVTFTLFSVVGVLTTTLLPRLHMQSRGALWSGTLKLYTTVFAVSMTVLTGLALMSTPVISLLYERGAFGPADTARVAGLLVFLVFGYALFPASAVLTRAVGLAGGNRALLLSAGVFLGVRSSIATVSYPHLGAPGLVLATTSAAVCQGVMLFWWLRSHCGPSPVGRGARAF